MEPTQAGNLSERTTALVVMAIMPLFFSSNIIFGRAAVESVEPFTLAFLRWFLTAMILYPIVRSELKGKKQAIMSLRWPLVVMGLCGMWVCGALVYLALKYTSATNGTLIYTSSPVLIILIEFFAKGRKVRLREGLGITLAFVGVVVIVAKGLMSNLTNMKFNYGDIIFVVCAVTWAIYSVGLKSERFQPFSTLGLFFLIAATGALLLLPFAAFEIVYLKEFPTSTAAWGNIAGIVAIASLLAFSAFQFGVKVLGPSLAGIFLYLLPIYGVSLAILFLGETLATYHVWGVILVLGGVVLATLPAKLMQRR